MIGHVDFMGRGALIQALGLVDGYVEHFTVAAVPESMQVPADAARIRRQSLEMMQNGLRGASGP